MIDNLKQAAADLFTRLAPFGYTDLKWASIRVDLPSDECYVHVYCLDDFQENANYDHTVQHGYLSFYLEDGRFVIPDDFKTREERELHFMARRFGSNKELASQMVSAAGRAFALRMEQELAQLRTMIGGPRND